MVRTVSSTFVDHSNDFVSRRLSAFDSEADTWQRSQHHLQVGIGAGRHEQGRRNSFENHPDAEVFEISYRELALEFLRIYWPQAKAYPRADKSAVKDAVLRQSFGGSNALVISLIQAFQERLCPADAQWLTFLLAQRFEKDFDRLVKDCQTRVLKKNPLQYMQGYEFLFDKDDRTNRIYVRREVAVSLHRLRV